ncbi:hypothetical protein [Arthrobacter sp.]|uniref:hypothetical protein n=1 Tax=Arthrobacter sp. TaxID=1667 RepID=UPI003398D42E
MADDSAADDKKPTPFLGLSGTQTIGSAMAAVTSAVVGSFLGVAGTLIGAALGSVVATVGAALYARTLSSAATVAMKKIPKARVGALREVEKVAASAPSEAIEQPTKPARKPIAPKTWVKVGLASAATFAIAMVGITAVEFGTSQPISSLVSSTTGIDRASDAHTTTLGSLGGGQEAADQTDKPAKQDENPAKTGDGAADDDVPTDGPAVGGNSSTEAEEPGTGTSDGTEHGPAPAPETGQTAEPDSETSQAPAPEEIPEPDPAEQGGPSDGDAGTGQ